MKSFLIRTFLAASLVIMLFAGNVFADENKEVEIHLPEFNVWINGVLVNNINNQYPFIVYNDITYFPMTWMDSRFLGLATSWDETNGLAVTKTNQFDAYQPYDSALNNPNKTYYAEILNDIVRVNNKEIDNANEPYPLLAYRDVTYFPLTWRFAVDEFGWNYSWTAEDGLKIDTPNPKTGENEKYNILSVLNTTAFGQGYDIYTKGTLNNGAETFSLNGKVGNQFNDTEFVSNVKLQDDYSFLTASIHQWNWRYGIENKFTNDPVGSGLSASYSSSNGGLTTPSAFFASPMSSVNKFQVIGEMRENIKECKKISDGHYILTFQENSKWADRKMEIKIDPKTLSLHELIIDDKNSRFGQYHMDTNFDS